jgi:hypothetical protein
MLVQVMGDDNVHDNSDDVIQCVLMRYAKLYFSLIIY